jgi:hypothetical protein
MQQSTTDIKYPLSLKDSKYFITFRARDYKYKNKKDIELTTVEKIPLCNISLYFPQNFQEDLEQNWGESQIFSSGSLVGALLDKVKGRAGAPIYNKLNPGVAINPSEELMYQGPGFRSFNFNFDLMVKNKEEEQTIKTIEGLFKVLQCSRLAKDVTYLAFPAIWEIEIVGLQDENLFTMGFKDKYFALTSVAISYTPDGSYQPLTSGFTIKTNLSLNFREISPMYRQELKGEPSVQGIVGSIENFLGI